MGHEISEGFLQKVGRNYFMWLSIDGQKERQKTGTDDSILADEMLQEWKALAKTEPTQDTRLRYEQMRDSYLGSGKTIRGAALRDLDTFFKNIRIAAISVDKLKKFRQWRESQDRVLESKQENIAKEIAWRLKKEGKVTPEQKKKIEREATNWVESGVEGGNEQTTFYASCHVQLPRRRRENWQVGRSNFSDS